MSFALKCGDVWKGSEGVQRLSTVLGQAFNLAHPPARQTDVSRGDDWLHEYTFGLRSFVTSREEPGLRPLPRRDTKNGSIDGLKFQLVENPKVPHTH